MRQDAHRGSCEDSDSSEKLEVNSIDQRGELRSLSQLSGSGILMGTSQVCFGLEGPKRELLGLGLTGS